jgi:hypothetical protein
MDGETFGAFYSKYMNQERGEEIWQEIVEKFPQLIKNYYFIVAYLDTSKEFFRNLYIHGILKDEDVTDYIRNIGDKHKFNLIKHQSLNPDETHLLDRAVRFNYLILDKIKSKITEDDIGELIDKNPYMRFLDVSETVSPYLAICALFKLGIVRQDFKMLSLVFSILLEEGSEDYKIITEAFFMQMDRENQADAIDELAAFISKATNSGLNQTYIIVFYEASTMKEKAEESVKYSALWVAKREKLPLERVFEIVIHYFNIHAVSRSTGVLRRIFKGFYDAGLSVDFIRNHSQEGEDWYAEDILSVSDV